VIAVSLSSHGLNSRPLRNGASEAGQRGGRRIGGCPPTSIPVRLCRGETGWSEEHRVLLCTACSCIACSCIACSCIVCSCASRALASRALALRALASCALALRALASCALAHRVRLRTTLRTRAPPDERRQGHLLMWGASCRVPLHRMLLRAAREALPCFQGQHPSRSGCRRAHLGGAGQGAL
jgi:hypothetical protein